MADADELWLLRCDPIHHAKSCVLVDWLRALRSQHGKYLEWWLNVDDRAIHLIELTKRLSRLKLDTLILFIELGLDEGEEETRRFLIDGGVLEE